MPDRPPRMIRRKQVWTFDGLCSAAIVFGVALLLSQLILEILLVVCGGTPSPLTSARLTVPAFILAGVAAWKAFRRSSWRLVVDDGTHCARCGYDLNGNTTGHCPECGGPTNAARAGSIQS